MNVCVSFIHAAFWVHEIREKGERPSIKIIGWTVKKGPFCYH